MDNIFFSFLSGFNFLFCRYTIKKIIDDVKIEKKKMRDMVDNSDRRKIVTVMKQSVIITVLMLQW